MENTLKAVLFCINFDIPGILAPETAGKGNEHENKDHWSADLLPAAGGLRQTGAAAGAPGGNDGTVTACT